MSEFSNLLKSSRFASLAKPLTRKKGKTAPTHQVVETRASSLHRQEWGIKYALPSKIKSRYITFNDVDSMERIVDFEANGSDHWKRLRFQEIGVPVALNEGVKNPLFNKAVERVTGTDAKLRSIENVLNLKEDLSTKEVKALQLAFKQLRPEFLEFLKSEDPVLLSNVLNKDHSIQSKFEIRDQSFAKHALKFLAAYKAKTTTNQIQSITTKSDQFKTKAFGGLSYSLKGRLSTTPNGIQDKKIVAGRYLSHNGADSIAAIGGFTSTLPAFSSIESQMRYITGTEGKELRERVVPFHVHGATMDKNGTVTLNSVNPGNISTVNAARHKRSGKKSPILKNSQFAELLNSLKND